MPILFNLFLSAAIISAVLYISKTNTSLGGFIMALPTSTLIALVLFQVQNGDPVKSAELAKSIFFAIPASLLFFIPFFLAEKFKFGFWASYAMGVFLLALGYLWHRHFVK